MVRRLVSSWIFTWAAFLCVGAWWALHVLPRAEHWVQFGNMVVADVPLGDSVIMDVDRIIRRAAFGEWTVVLRRQQASGWNVHCTAEGQGDYFPGAALPDPLTLEWWTEGQCEPKLPGLYFITTTWTFYPEWVAGPRVSLPLVSNTFRVVEVPE